MAHIQAMEKKETLADVERWFEQTMSGVWPAGLGSLSLRRSPCIRKNCHACETGEQHSSYVLYVRRRGRRVVIYIPDSMAPRIRELLERGQRYQQVLHEAAERYARALKREGQRER